jgi:hypothetical protein
MGGNIMHKRIVFLATCAVMGLAALPVFGQCGCGSAPTVYAPVASSETAYYPSPTVTYYAPATEVAYASPPTVAYYPSEASTVTYYSPVAQPYTTYYAPPVAQPYVTYYTPPVAQPYATYYAPAAPTVVRPYGVVGENIYGAPKVYIRGEPVRNALRAITP